MNSPRSKTCKGSQADQESRKEEEEEEVVRGSQGQREEGEHRAGCC